MAAASGYSLLAKAVTSAVSVVKADHVQGGVCTKRDTEVFLWLLVLLLTALFDKLICHLSTFGKMILAPLKSIVARVYLKKPLYSWFPHTDKCTKLFTKNIPEYFAHA